MEIQSIEQAVILWGNESTRELFSNQLRDFFKEYREGNKVVSRENLVEQIVCKQHAVGLSIIPTTHTYDMVGENIVAYEIVEPAESMKIYLDNIHILGTETHGYITLRILDENEPVNVNTSDVYKCEIV